MKRLLLLCLALPLLLTCGCWHRKNKPKEVTAVASDVEEAFQQRWLERRTGELVAQGQRVDVARQQAIDEFRARYTYFRTVNK